MVLLNILHRFACRFLVQVLLGDVEFHLSFFYSLYAAVLLEVDFPQHAVDGLAIHELHVEVSQVQLFLSR